MTLKEKAYELIRIQNPSLKDVTNFEITEYLGFEKVYVLSLLSEIFKANNMDFK